MQKFCFTNIRVVASVIIACLLYIGMVVKFDFLSRSTTTDRWPLKLLQQSQELLKNSLDTNHPIDRKEWKDLKPQKNLKNPKDSTVPKIDPEQAKRQNQKGAKDSNNSSETKELNMNTQSDAIEPVPPTDAVILLSQMRSGSSVLGELFNQRINVSFFYEPLYPFGDKTCPQMSDDRVRVLEKISKCRFDLDEHYNKAYAASQLTDSFAKCMKTKICFTVHPKCSRFLSRDTNICKVNARDQQICPEPINTKALSKHCNTSSLRAMKVIYLCELESLLPLLMDPTVNVKVLHLVRDPRATVSSRVAEMKGYKSGENPVNIVRETASQICGRLSNNVKFADDVIAGDAALRQKYMRIRHEDFALDAVRAAQAVYNFVGINMTGKMREWIEKATSTRNAEALSVKDTQSTSRDPHYVVSAWRRKLSFRDVDAIQQVCEEALFRLNYWGFENEKQLKDLENHKSFVLKTFSDKSF